MCVGFLFLFFFLPNFFFSGNYKISFYYKVKTNIWSCNKKKIAFCVASLAFFLNEINKNKNPATKVKLPM